MRREAHLLRWQGSYEGQDTVVLIWQKPASA